MLIKVRVKTREKRESLLKKSEDTFLVSVKESPERGLANTRVLELMADYFKVPKNKVHIVKGHTTPSKILSV